MPPDFVFERDLQPAAIAMHHMQNRAGPNGPVAYSEVFAGHFDHKRLTRGSKPPAKPVRQYADRTIYSLESQGRTVRIVMLGYDWLRCRTRRRRADPRHRRSLSHRRAALLRVLRAVGV